MKFKVQEKETGREIDADDYANRYWTEQREQKKKSDADPFNEHQLPYLFFKKCDWLIDREAYLYIQDSCGNVVAMNNERFEAVNDPALCSECAKWEGVARNILANSEAPQALDREQLVHKIECIRIFLHGSLSETRTVPT